MPGEGLEPHEVLERTAHQLHHSGNGKTSGAILAAILSVLAAIGSLFAGHAVNQAILLQAKATDQWAYYQAKSTKGHLYTMGKDVISALNNKDTIDLKKFDDQISKYNEEKTDIQNKALILENESRQEFLDHTKFSFAISLFQIGIVLASLSILVGYRWMFYSSILCGGLGIAELLIGLFL